MGESKHTPVVIDRDEECGFCSMPRHAHWGGPQAAAAGRCAGFQSTDVTRLRAAAPDMLAALREAEPLLAQQASANPTQPHGIAKRDKAAKAAAAIRAAIAKAEGRA